MILRPDTLAINGMRRAVAARYNPLNNYLVSGAWPIIFTMFVAGIWHGSGWVFVLYGLLHGIAIAVNNAWKQFSMPSLPPLLAWLLTMSVVVSGLVIFRAADVPTALTVLSSMWGITGFTGEMGTPMVVLTLDELLPMILVFGAIVLLAPNSQEILRHHWISSSTRPEAMGRLAETFAWRPAFGWAFVSMIGFVVTFTNIEANSTFLYYQF